MPFSVRGKEALTESLRLRLTTTEKDALKEDAVIAGLTLSELVRRRYFGKKPIVANADLTVVRQLLSLRGQLMMMHNETGGVYSEETARILREIKIMIQRISHDR